MTGAPQLQRLVRAHVELDAECPSPGAMHSCRVAVLAPNPGDVSCTAFMASGAAVYSIQVPLDSAGPLQRGREGIAMPQAVTGAVTRRWDQLTHRAEVQSLALAERGSTAVLASVDAYGRALVALFDTETADLAEPQHMYSAQPASLLREAGWAGAAIAAEQGSLMAVARHFPRDLTVFDGDRVVRTCGLLHPPHAVAFVAGGPATATGAAPLLAIAEGHQVALWDIRVSERGGCVERLSPATTASALYAVAADDSGSFVGAAGADRGVSVWDARKWHVLDRWTNTTKYEPYFLMFCSSCPQHAVVAGLDPEVVCGRWDSLSRRGGGMRTGEGPAHRPSESTSIENVTFRGTSRWLGVAKAAGTDTVAGFAASGDAFIAQYAPSPS